MDAASLRDLVGYQDLASAGLTRRQFERLVEAEEYRTDRTRPVCALRCNG